MPSRDGCHENEKPSELPYELMALEVALSAVCKALDLEANEVEARICPALDNLAQKVSKRDLEDIRNLKSRLNRVFARTGKVKQVREIAFSLCHQKILLRQLNIDEGFYRCFNLA